MENNHDLDDYLIENCYKGKLHFLVNMDLEIYKRNNRLSLFVDKIYKTYLICGLVNNNFGMLEELSKYPNIYKIKELVNYYFDMDEYLEFINSALKFSKNLYSILIIINKNKIKSIKYDILKRIRNLCYHNYYSVLVYKKIYKIFGDDILSETYSFDSKLFNFKVLLYNDIYDDIKLNNNYLNLLELHKISNDERNRIEKIVKDANKIIKKYDKIPNEIQNNFNNLREYLFELDYSLIDFVETLSYMNTKLYFTNYIMDTIDTYYDEIKINNLIGIFLQNYQYGITYTGHIKRFINRIMKLDNIAYDKIIVLMVEMLGHNHHIIEDIDNPNFFRFLYDKYKKDDESLNRFYICRLLLYLGVRNCENLSEFVLCLCTEITNNIDRLEYMEQRYIFCVLGYKLRLIRRIIDTFMYTTINTYDNRFIQDMCFIVLKKIRYSYDQYKYKLFYLIEYILNYIPLFYDNDNRMMYKDIFNKEKEVCEWVGEYCELTGIKINNLVVLPNGCRCEYDMIVKNIILYGKNPYTNEPLTITELDNYAK